MPLVADMVTGHNSTLIWDAAWVIMSLANPDIIVEGPFRYGMHSLYWWEDQIRGTTDDVTMTSTMAINNVLIDLYSTTWNQAYDALRGSGLHTIWKH